MVDIKTILANKRLDRHSDKWHRAFNKITEEDVNKALNNPRGRYSFERLATFLSPAAKYYLEEMAQLAQGLTIQRFGSSISLYAPLYVSSYCTNNCAYCAYNASNMIKRKRLSIDEAVAEADIIASEGFRHILLVSSRDSQYITTDYLAGLAQKLKPRFSSISVEIPPMSQGDYQKLFKAGIDGVTLYQETYNRAKYAKYHPAGPKSDYNYRLDSHNRTASAGMRRLGIGVLLGLFDWRIETLALGEHAAFLMKKYWKSQVSFSFPRLRPASNAATKFDYLITDDNLVQMMLALRLCFADAGIVLSTRERAPLRDELVKLCVTRMSAGSKTSPGGYSGRGDSVNQFEIDDNRSPGEIAEQIKSSGLEVVWKDWDVGFNV